MSGIKKLYRAAAQVNKSVSKGNLNAWHEMNAVPYTGSNKRLPDSSGNSNDAELYTGRGLSFDGINDLVTIGDTQQTIKTVVFYANPDSTTTPFMQLQTAGAARIEVNSGTLSATGFTSPTLYVNGVAGSTVAATTWQMIAVTSATGVSASNVLLGQSNTDYGSIDMSNVKFFSTELTAGQIAELYANPEQVLPTGGSSGELVAWWPLADGSTPGIALDASGNNNHGTIAGATERLALPSPSSQFAIKGNSQPMYFDNVNDHINFGDVLDFGTSDFTLLGWILPTSISGDNTILAKYDNNQNNGYQIYWSSGRPRAELRANGIRYVTAPGDTLDKNLTLVVGVFDRSGNLDCYVNGALINSVDISTESSTDIQNTVTLKAGLANVFGNKYFPGVIYTTAIFNTILSSIEIAEIYNGGAGFDLLSDIGDYASSANLQGYWKNIGNTAADWIDISGNGNNGTVNGSPSTIYLPEGVTAGKDIIGVTLTNLNTGELITSADGYALIADAASLDITTAITLEAWVKPFTVSTAQTIIGKNGAYALGLNNSGKPIFTKWTGTTPTVAATSITNLTPDTWYHLAATYDGTDIKLYVNGALDTTIPATGIIDTNNADILLGALTSSTELFNGYIDSTKVYETVLTNTQIYNNYLAEKLQHQ